MFKMGPDVYLDTFVNSMLNLICELSRKDLASLDINSDPVDQWPRSSAPPYSTQFSYTAGYQL